MNTRHYPFWPKRLAKTLSIPKTTLVHNLEVSAQRYPDKPAIEYYGTSIPYRQLWDEVQKMAGFLQHELHVKPGDRILLYMQNSPQFVIAYYAVLYSEAVVVPINPMNLTDEIQFYIDDCNIQIAFTGQELAAQLAPLIGRTSLQHVIVAAYSSYANPEFSGPLPDEVKASPKTFAEAYWTPWEEALSKQLAPDPSRGQADDLAVLPYTSGTTGRPKGCMHTHETVQANVVGAVYWSHITSDAVVLATLPLFHVTGMQHSMNAPIFSGSTIVLMTRWNRDLAAQLVERYQCTHWVNISTMVVDFLANPNITQYRLDSLASIGGGGAPLSQAVGEKLFQLLSIKYAEGYGLSETISQTHFNPPERPKLQCMGIPSFDVDARIVDPETLEELGPYQEGEVIVHGPQVFKGYWNRPEETEKAFVTLDGKRFFRTGDIAKYDEEGYFFIVDRIKRMINAAGFKVWPTEVESILYKHPAVKEACVIGVPDERRGETVKAFVVLHDHAKGTVTEEAIIEWAKGQMAAYKYPRIVQFMDRLPLSGSGKILWRKLQEEELAKLQNQ
jgi:fatty-acyl-CoA synthase